MFCLYQQGKNFILFTAYLHNTQTGIWHIKILTIYLLNMYKDTDNISIVWKW